jgi:hypothetical protein
MPPHSKRTNFYEPYTKGKNIYALPQGRFAAQMKFKNNYQKSRRFYGLEEARVWIDDNYDELAKIAETGPGADWFEMCNQVSLDNFIKRDFIFPPYNTPPQ